MPTVEERLSTLEARMQRAMATTAALQGQPADATLSIPHNDTFPYADNVDGAGGFAGNLRYVIASNVQRVVSARLSIHLAPYRTYNSLSLTATGNESRGHNHSHAHTIPANGNSPALFIGVDAGGLLTAGTAIGGAGSGGTSSAINSDSTAESQTHTHSVTGSAVLGVTEGTTATAVAIAFDGVDATALLSGPFNADVIELNVLPFLPLTKGVFHTIAMLPAGLGRIEAHLRLGVYVSAGSAF